MKKTKKLLFALSLLVITTSSCEKDQIQIEETEISEVTTKANKPLSSDDDVLDEVVVYAQAVKFLNDPYSYYSFVFSASIQANLALLKEIADGKARIISNREHDGAAYELIDIPRRVSNN